MIEISSRLKKLQMKQQKELEDKINILETEHKLTSNKETLKQTRQRLDELLTYKAKGAIRFSRQRYYEMSNRASRLLVFQLQKAQSSRVIAKIIHPKSKESMTSPKDIAEAFGAYFKELHADSDYTSRNEYKDFFSKIHLPSLTEKEAQDIIKPITEQEETIKSLKNSKSPGTDGLPGEFYKFFAEQLSPVLVKVFNYALSKGDLPQTWSEAIISVLYKEEKDPTKCEGYRPISLLGNDLKILTNILAHRMQKIVAKLINPDQTGFIPFRQGANNIRRIINIISTAQKTKQTSLVISLDAQKAFKRVRWGYLFETLEVFGFNPVFINWIETNYNNPQSCIRVNGCCSDFFPVKKGVRQGDCLSPLLFAISTEPLAESIRHNKDICGIIDEGQKEHKISLFADDLLAFISKPTSSIPALLGVLNEYGKISGFLTTETKSTAVMLFGEKPAILEEKNQVPVDQERV